MTRRGVYNIHVVHKTIISAYCFPVKNVLVDSKKTISTITAYRAQKLS